MFNLFRTKFYADRDSGLQPPTVLSRFNVPAVRMTATLPVQRVYQILRVVSSVVLAIYAALSRLLADPIPLTAKLRCGGSTPEA